MSFAKRCASLELQFGLRQHAALTERSDQVGGSAKEQTGQVDAVMRRLEQAELDLEQARLKHAEREKETTQGQTGVFHLSSEIQRIEGRIEFGNKEFETLERQQERVTLELAEIERRLHSADQEEESLRQAQQEQSRVFAEEEIRLAESEDMLLDFSEQEDNLGRQLDQARQKLYLLLAELTRMSSQQEEADRRLAVLADVTERNRHEAITVTGQLERLQHSSSDLTSTLEIIEK